MPQTPELAARQAQSEVARLRADNAALRAQTQQLATENDHLTRLLESAPESVLGMDRHGIVTDWNRGAQRILGWSAEEAIGQRLSGLIIPTKHRAAHEAGMQRYLQTGQSRVLNRLIEIEAQHKDGRLIWVELSIWAVEQDHNAGFGAFIRDVSERKQSQELLRDSEERYRSMVEHLDEGMLVIQDGRVVFGNTRASDILRVSPGALPQADFLQWLHPDDRALAGERQRRRQAGEQAELEGADVGGRAGDQQGEVQDGEHGEGRAGRDRVDLVAGVRERIVAVVHEVERDVTLTSAYFMGKTPVTVKAFRTFVAETKYRTEAEQGSSVLFSFDIVYAGVFRLQNIPQEPLHHRTARLLPKH